MSRDRAIDQARARLAKSQPNALRRLTGLSDARAARRDAGAVDPAARQALEDGEQAAAAALVQARSSAKKDADAVDAALARWLARQRSFAREVGQLETSAPIVLLPVRLEARFLPVGAPTELVVRVYPDAIAADAHEPELTAMELAAGRAYWDAATTRQQEQDAWAGLLMTMSAERAAWVVATLDPQRAATPGSRPASWTRPVRARGLPDRWLVQAWRGGTVVHEMLGGPITLQLALSPDPIDDGARRPIALSPGGPAIDAGLLWTHDLSAAEQAGMAVRLGPLGAGDLADGFDRVVAIGVRAHETPAEGAAELAGLFTAHRFTHGVGFVRPGTPTNNTEEARSGAGGLDPHHADSFQRERTSLTIAPQSNGARATDALGITGALRGDLGHWEGATDVLDAAVPFLHDALFPVLLGYPLEQFGQPQADPAAVAALREFFVNRVRPGGHLPVVRIGEIPYGLLAVGDLSKWAPEPGATGPLAYLPAALRALLPSWQAAAPGVPRIGGSADPESDLIRSLQTTASSDQAFVRSVWGPDVALNMVVSFGVGQQAQWSRWQRDRERLRQAHERLLASAGWPPAALPWSLIGLVPRADSYEFRHSLVQAELSETRVLDVETQLRVNGGPGTRSYPAWVAQATVDELRQQTVERPALLYLLLRHALLLEYRRVGLDLLIGAGVLPAEARQEPELVEIELANGTRRDALWTLLAHPLPAAGAMPLLDFLHAGRVAETAELDGYRRRVERLSRVPTAVLHRITGEALDATAHRLDPWAGAVASERLAAVRANQPDGSHVGGYGWILNVKPARTPASEGGFVHAPSTDHAVTAAVLRSAFLNRPHDQPKHFAINLSSARVRLATELLDGVRQGQELAALLGYQFERALRDEARQGREARRHVARLRERYPLVAGKLTPAPAAGASALPARDVVDGLAMSRAANPFAVLQGVTAAELSALENARSSVRDMLDAVADLLLAESVHHLTGGRPDVAGASLDTLAAGARPPEPSIARSPRRGSDVQVRALLLFDPQAAPGPGWPALPTPRAAVSPGLDAWLGSLLGDPTKISCTVTWPSPTEAAPAAVTTAPVTLAQLNLRPIDLLTIVASPAASGQASELDLRILVAAGAPWTVTEWHRATIDLATPADAAHGRFADVLELVSLAQRVVADAPSVAIRDLLHPSAPVPAASATSPLPQRVQDARTALATARQALQVARNAASGATAPSTTELAALAAALRECALWGLSSAYGSPMPLRDVIARADRTLAEIDARLAQFDAGNPSATLGAIFGRSLPVLDETSVPQAVRADLIASLDAPMADEETMRRWTAQTARTRSPLDRWRRLGLVAHALGRPHGVAEAAQSPFSPGVKWAATSAPAGSPLALAVLHAGVLRAGRDLCGIVLDQWTEHVPSAAARTALAYHYDAPSAEAPQAVLIVVPPNRAAATWSADALLGAVHQTIDMSVWRGVDGDGLQPLVPLLPATAIAANAGGDTAAIAFDNLLLGPEA